MSALEGLGFGTAASPFAHSPNDLAQRLLAGSSLSGRVDTSALNAELAVLARTDAPLAAETRAQIEAQLAPVERGELARTQQVAGTLTDGTPVTFSPDGVAQDRWIETLRTSSDPGQRGLYDTLVRTAGSTDPEAIKGVLADAYQRGIAPAQIGQPAANDNPGVIARIANAADALNPLNRLADLSQSGAASIARSAGVGETEWGARLQTLLDTPGTAAAFRQGINEGVLEGGKDMVVGVAGLVGGAAQYMGDRSLSGFAGDKLRDLTGGLPGWADAILPSANRADATQASVANTAGAIGDYVASRAGDPALLASDASAAFGKAWDGLKASHAEAAAKGPEAEARWFGAAMGRTIFEVGSTFVPVAGVAGKVDKVADGARAVEGLIDGAKAGAGLAKTIDETHVAELLANGVKLTPENLLATGRAASGQVLFLEVGNSKAGLQHIIDKHGADFARIGVPEDRIADVVMKAVTEGKLVGYQGQGQGRGIYELILDAQNQRIAVSVGSNGFIVGANPAGKAR
jgi:hypothetical protein